MSLTIFGVLVVITGLVLILFESMQAMLAFVMLTTLLGGSAALALPSLGGSTIPPASLALVFFLLRAILPGPRQMTELGKAIGDNVALLAFGLYGSITAYLLPRLFSGAAKVTPLRPGAVRQLYESAPIHFSSQNITTSVYMLGTTAAGLCASIGASREGSERLIVRMGVFIAVAHAMLGFISVVVAGTSLNIIVEVFRNGHYAQLDQSIGGLSRMNGIWPEASGFAAYGGTWLIFMTELWLRDVSPRLTGLAAAFLASALTISTSSTAYVSLLGYVTILGMRTLLLPRSVPGHKLMIAAAGALGAVILLLAMMLVVPGMFDSFVKILRIMTVDKTESSSGQQRLFWALQGIEAFTASIGLGIGAGTFRSSSLIMAIAGSMGVIGLATFAAHILRAFKPLRQSTWFASLHSERTAVGVSASWTALLMLMPAAISAPSPDPGIVWALFAGIALGLRRAPQMVRQPPSYAGPSGRLAMRAGA